MTPLQAIVSIVVALIAGTTGGGLVFTKFIIERQDKLKENNTQKLIDDAIDVARKDITQEIKDAVRQGIVDCGVIGDKAIREVQEEFVKKLDEGLKARGEEGAERFKIHAESFKEVNKLVAENTKQIGELTEISKQTLKSLSALSKMARTSAESQKSNNYDRILLVGKNVLKNQRITLAEKTNLKQLYNSWVDFHEEGEKLDPKITTLYDECMKFTPIPDEG